VTERRAPTDWAALVAEGVIKAAHVPRLKRQLRAEEAWRAKQQAKRDAENAAWRERQEEEARMAPAWADFVLAHSPALADLVVHADLPLREAVRCVNERSGCEVGCDHRPLTPDEVDRFIHWAATTEDPA
jgi:hypothetical protein